MSLGDVTSARSSPAPEACPECDTSASVTSDLHKYQVACTCKPSSAQYACADDPGPPAPAKTDTPPALPPRPPTSVLAATNRRNNTSVGCNGNDGTCRRRKYAWWCVGCGALAAALGGLLAAQHILLRAYTASPQHLETVPAAVPAAMLVLTGVCIMSLARRRNRYSYMIKVVGACCLVCALTCVLVTITTTVIHMNKLQTLKFCEYTKLTRTCTCFSMPPDSQHSSADDEGVRCVFEGVSECGVVHGALYWCLRGVFALSVSAVLVCIFSCMLAYQLLSHERKKMYWEQLELRCRSLYRPSAGQAAPSAGRQVQSNCSCCAQCHPTQPAWDISLQHRFWAPGRIGNLYSPNPGTGRKTSAWSWFPWPRSNSQNSRCRMGVPQSGDSAYGFCETEAAQTQQTQGYDDRYPHSFNQTPFNRAQTSGTFAQIQGNFAQGSGNFVQGQANFPQPSFSQEGFGEASGSFDAATGVWGPPPPYSPQGRSGSRHHLHHQDPAAATLLHHHHMEHRTNIHEHPSNIQPHTCARNSYLMHQNLPPTEMSRINPDLTRINPELARMNPELARMNPELARINPELAEFARINPELARMNPEVAHMGQMYPQDIAEMARLQAELAHMPPEARFNTLRGHLVPYRCQRLGMSASNLHRDCRIDDTVAIECLHQKSASKVSDQSSDSCQKQGKENLGFQNDKHSPIRSSMQDCRAANQNAESEVYFADVSSCCNVSVKAECCMNANVSALVGTIENHPESTSESDTGSFTLTRQQRPQPQVGSKRRPRQTEKHIKNQEKMRQVLNNSIRLTEHQIEQLNNSMRMNERIERERMNETRLSERMNDSRDRLNDRDRIERINDCRISDRMNETRLSERMNDSRDRLNEGRVCERERLERLNDSRISDRMNETRMSERMNETRKNERMNDSRDRLNDSRNCEVIDPRIERMNDSRISDRMNETRLSERMNDSRVCERMNEARMERMNDSKLSDRSDTRHSDRMNDSRLERMNDSRLERMSELNSSIRIGGSPKMRTHISPLRIPRSSPKNVPKDHPRQSSSDSNKPDFRQISPLSPNTEESLLSDDDRPQDQVYSNDPETSKCLGPDSQYEPVRETKEEILKTNHHHCYSDTNTMDSGWQSGSEKQVTD
ncbi:uncharacterized protein LOC111349947 isoform X2 [Spodoptera litura]|uniref:Uncharacterized protein LOC111349947 isoform X2 n=1 Tax=Spodoptera litura TaxID=69820 RepID=A0A9J7IJ45_SPOLT|nr:uncharacterized protein LOC111349947 isoform X2 [Spodoptera litura]